MISGSYFRGLFFKKIEHFPFFAILTIFLSRKFRNLLDILTIFPENQIHIYGYFNENQPTEEAHVHLSINPLLGELNYMFMDKGNRFHLG